MNILLILLSQEVRQMISFCLESRFNARVTETRSTSEAILSHFDLKREMPDLIICDHPLNSESLQDFLASKKLNIPLIICALAPEKVRDGNQENTFFAAPGTILNEAERRVQDKLNQITIAETTSEEADHFLSIRTQLLLNASPLHSDIYIRLSPTKHVKLMRKGDRFEVADYEKYALRKKIPYLFIHRDDLSTVIGKFQEEIVRLMSATAEPHSANEMSMIIQETTLELIKKLGPTAEIQDLIKKNIQLSLHSVGRSPQLKNILARLQSDKEHYISSHSVYLAQLSCTLASAMEWHSDSTFHKLTLASYLHDIVLENQELARISSLKDLDKDSKRFTAEEIAAFKNHPMEAAEIARKFSEVPPDVDTLILQHHEQPDGSGFPRGLTHSHIGQLATVFIVSHDLVDFIFDNDGEFSMEDFLETVRTRYDCGNFRKVMKCLSQIRI